MPSIRHHLTLAEACLIAGRAHLDSALDHTIGQAYDLRWTGAIDDRISQITRLAVAVNNIKTCIQPPVSTRPMPPCNLSTPHED